MATLVTQNYVSHSLGGHSNKSQITQCDTGNYTSAVSLATQWIFIRTRQSNKKSRGIMREF